MSDNPGRLDKYLERISVPEHFGPGKWDDMHLLGFHARTYEKKMQFIYHVELVIKNLRCQECRDDSLSYMKSHPITSYWNKFYNGEDIGFFLWSVDFHNYVNRKLGKPEVPTEVAYRLYKYPDEFICKEGCGGSNNNSSEKINTPTPKPSYGFMPL